MNYKCGNEKGYVLEINYLRQSERIFPEGRREKVRNDVIREIASTYKQYWKEIRSLKWFDQLMKMEQERFPISCLNGTIRKKETRKFIKIVEYNRLWKITAEDTIDRHRWIGNKIIRHLAA